MNQKHFDSTYGDICSILGHFLPLSSFDTIDDI